MVTPSTRTVLSQMASQAAILGIGLVSLVTAWCYATLENRTLWPEDTQEQREHLNSAQDRFWNLDREPLAGFRHAFFKTRRNVQLHYIINDVKKSDDVSKPLVVFIHGFPDSCFLWRHLLQSPQLQNSTLVAVDLPGYGGSDSLPSYDAFNVLEALTEFLLEMRRAHVSNGDKLVMVTHDWGSLIGARLASEAKGLADHWILTSGMIPHLTVSNAQHQALLAQQLLSSWRRAPLQFHLVKDALNAYAPVLAQFRRSFYIFCFLLPWPLATTFATFGNYWFLRVCHRYGIRPAPDDAPADPRAQLEAEAEAEAMAISTGPASPQFKHTHGSSPACEHAYGSSVQARTRDRGMAQKLKIYRDALFTGEWEKSQETVDALGSASSRDDVDVDADVSSPVPTTTISPNATVATTTAPKGALQTPATILYGENDPAFIQALVLGNAAAYLVPGSRVCVVQRGGHWLPLEHRGRRVVERVLRWVVGEEDGELVLRGVEGVRVVEVV
ncbi:hypothetical protein J1614_005761 [Plenodomus biglobosus]|nr:hypothetical protein J1614_005761 [Plenodomus biglobosus]